MSLWLLIALAAAIAAVFFLAPRPTLSHVIPAPRVPGGLDPAELERWLKEQEANVPGVIEGAEATIAWADGPAVQDLCLLYTHGFSASRRETAPLCDEIARDLGANLIYARLAGHGLSEDAMSASAEDWLRSMVDSWEIASRLGRQVILVGTSTGAPLTVWLCQQVLAGRGQLDRVHSLVFLSPNFRLRNPFGFLLTWPFAERWVPRLLGQEHSWEPENELAGRYWTPRYSLLAVIEMQKVVDWVRRHGSPDHALPLLTVYMEGDPTISHEAAIQFHERWQHGSKELIRVSVDDENPQHVFVGEITAPHRLRWCVETCLAFIHSVDRQA